MRLTGDGGVGSPHDEDCAEGAAALDAKGGTHENGVDVHRRVGRWLGRRGHRERKNSEKRDEVHLYMKHVTFLGHLTSIQLQRESVREEAPHDGDRREVSASGC